jgi:hypothetical protein
MPVLNISAEVIQEIARKAKPEWSTFDEMKKLMSEHGKICFDAGVLEGIKQTMVYIYKKNPDLFNL